MGLKLYGLPMPANVVSVEAALNEKGLDYELVDISSGAHNPFGQIPALEDGDSVLFEWRKINRYIASKFLETGPDLLRSGGGPAEVEEWLEVESKQFAPPIADLVFEILIKPLCGERTEPAVVDELAEKLGKVLDVYEAHLSKTKSKYLAGGDFTLADLNHMAHINYLMQTPKRDLFTDRPHVLAWWQEISARPAWKKTADRIPSLSGWEANKARSWLV